MKRKSKLLDIKCKTHNKVLLNCEVCMREIITNLKQFLDGEQ